MDDCYSTGVRQAKEAFVKGIYLQYFRLCLQKDRDSLPKDIARVCHIQDLIDGLKSDEINSYMITINPPALTDTKWDKLEELYADLIQKKNFLKEPQNILEQRSTELDRPYGWHMHIATGLLTSKADAIRRCYASYKKIIGDHGDQVIDVRPSPKAYDYVSGKKTSSKQELMEVDSALRQIRSG